MWWCGGDLWETQAFLDHQRSDATVIYLQQLMGEEHRHWQAIVNTLGLEGLMVNTDRQPAQPCPAASPFNPVEISLLLAEESGR